MLNAMCDRMRWCVSGRSGGAWAVGSVCVASLTVCLRVDLLYTTLSLTLLPPLLYHYQYHDRCVSCGHHNYIRPSFAACKTNEVALHCTTRVPLPHWVVDVSMAAMSASRPLLRRFL